MDLDPTPEVDLDWDIPTTPTISTDAPPLERSEPVADGWGQMTPVPGDLRPVIDTNGEIVIDEEPYAEADNWVLLPPSQAVPVVDLDNPTPAPPPPGLIDTYAYLDDDGEVRTKTVWRPLQPDGTVIDPDYDTLAEHVEDPYTEIGDALAGPSIKFTTDAGALTRSTPAERKRLGSVTPELSTYAVSAAGAPEWTKPKTSPTDHDALLAATTADLLAEAQAMQSSLTHEADRLVSQGFRPGPSRPAPKPAPTGTIKPPSSLGRPTGNLAALAELESVLKEIHDQADDEDPDDYDDDDSDADDERPRGSSGRSIAKLADALAQLTEIVSRAIGAPTSPEPPAGGTKRTRARNRPGGPQANPEDPDAEVLLGQGPRYPLTTPGYPDYSTYRVSAKEMSRVVVSGLRGSFYCQRKTPSGIRIAQGVTKVIYRFCGARSCRYCNTAVADYDACFYSWMIADSGHTFYVMDIPASDSEKATGWLLRHGGAGLCIPIGPDTTRMIATGFPSTLIRRYGELGDGTRYAKHLTDDLTEEGRPLDEYLQSLFLRIQTPRVLHPAGEFKTTVKLLRKAVVNLRAARRAWMVRQAEEEDSEYYTVASPKAFMEAVKADGRLDPEDDTLKAVPPRLTPAWLNFAWHVHLGKDAWAETGHWLSRHRPKGAVRRFLAPGSVVAITAQMRAMRGSYGRSGAVLRI